MSLLTLLMLLVPGCTHKTLLKFEPDYAKEYKYRALIRIVAIKSDAECSAVVITPTLAITAGHCVVDPDTDEAVAKKGWNVYPNNSKESVTTAKSVGSSEQRDLGLITGDFKDFENAFFLNDPVRLIPASIDPTAETATSPVYACGYAENAKAASCGQFIPQYFFGFQVAGEGIFFPGMSGGMVFSPLTGEFLGVISAVMPQPNTVVVSSLFHVLDVFGIEHD